MPKICTPEYLAKVQSLNKEETERLLSRMTGKLPKRLEKEKLNKQEALAIQMELEDEQLEEWRANMRKLKEKDEAKALAKVKTEKVSPEKKSVAPAKSKTTSKAKPAAKTPPAAKPKVVAKPKEASGK